MSYSLDLRERANSYVTQGGSTCKAARIFGINRQTIYNWLHASSLAPQPSISRRRKLDKAALAAHVRDFPDALLRERAQHFGVHTNAIWVALRQMHIRKKNDEVC